uniref:protein-histidine N-methyltransferase n=1 Tax=Neogobius melanostomus TaxID=47308 RepID=A0A8C6SWD1_9GOBI
RFPKKEIKLAVHVEDKPRQAEQVKEAKEHPVPIDPHFLLTDAVPETVHIGTLPPLHFLNETVFEQTAPEREDKEKILSRTLQQKSDLISGVYEGGLKVWECTYDLLKLIEKDTETFGNKRILDLGCGAGLLGILALKRGARGVHFQDYNSTVIEQLTVPTVILNCQDDDVNSEDENGIGKVQKKSDCVTTDNKDSKDGNPPQKKRAIDPTLHTLSAKCRFFSGDWSTFLPLLLKETPPLKYDIIFTSETIYNADYYPSLHDTLQELLAPKGLVYLATKSHYFGVGGGLHLFETFVEKRGIFSVDHLWDGEEGLQRHIVSLKFKQTKH